VLRIPAEGHAVSCALKYESQFRNYFFATRLRMQHSFCGQAKMHKNRKSIVMHVSKKIFLPVAVIIAWMSGALPCAFADYYTAKNGQTPAAPYTSWVTAANSIQDAVNAAPTNGVVWVGAGRYTLPPNAVVFKGTNVVYIYKPLTLRSSNGVPATVTIDGEGKYRGVAVDYNYTSTNNFLIDGFTISNCFLAIAGSNGGAGIFFNAGDYTSTVRNCIICDNTVTTLPCTVRTDGGGGIFIQSRPAYSPMYYIITNCIFRGNRVFHSMLTGGGGGAYLITSRGGRIDNCLFEYNSVSNGGGGGLMYFGTAGAGVGTNEIRNSVIRNNWQTQAASDELGGGGIELVYQSVLIMWNCLVYNNWTVNRGGGIYNMKSYNPLLLFNCTVVSNRALGNSAGGIDCRDAGDSIQLCNSIICSNRCNAVPDIYFRTTVPSYLTNCCVTSTNLGEGQHVSAFGPGMVTNSPAFVDFAGQDFRLMSASPCFNKGTNQPWMVNGADLDGLKRLRYGTVDIGAYEFMHDATIYKFH
jgi:hypothetical protein